MAIKSIIRKYQDHPTIMLIKNLITKNYTKSQNFEISAVKVEQIRKLLGDHNPQKVILWLGKSLWIY